MTVLLRPCLKLDYQVLILCVQTPVLIFTLGGHNVTTQWSLCYVRVRFINCFVNSLAFWFYMCMCIVYLLYISVLSTFLWATCLK